METEKQASLTVLEKKVLPMERLFSEFTAWLSGSEVALGNLSPPATEEGERAEQLTTANVSLKLHLNLPKLYSMMHVYVHVCM